MYSGVPTLAVNPHRVTRMAFQPQIHVRDRTGVAAGDDVEDSAFSGDDRQAGRPARRAATAAASGVASSATIRGFRGNIDIIGVHLWR